MSMVAKSVVYIVYAADVHVMRRKRRGLDWANIRRPSCIAAAMCWAVRLLRLDWAVVATELDDEDAVTARHGGAAHHLRRLRTDFADICDVRFGVDATRIAQQQGGRRWAVRTAAPVEAFLRKVTAGAL
eukprot:gene35295-49860_t